MSTSHNPQKRCLCLVHTDGMVRSIVVSVARELNLPPVEVYSTPSAALKGLAGHQVEAVMIFADASPEWDFITSLRAGELGWPSDMPLAILAPALSPERVARLAAFKPARLLVTPFRIKDLILTLEQMVQVERADDVLAAPLAPV